MFINFSDHPSCDWSNEQKNAAMKYGEIIDIPFPEVLPEADEEQIDSLAEEYADRMIAMRPAAVMCQGEYSVTFNVALRLIGAGITVLSACTEKCVISIREGVNVKSEALFSFVRFRRYSVKGVNISE